MYAFLSRTEQFSSLRYPILGASTATNGGASDATRIVSSSERQRRMDTTGFSGSFFQWSLGLASRGTAMIDIVLEDSLPRYAIEDKTDLHIQMLSRGINWSFQLFT
jgi:hypothetical protein